MDEGSGRRRSSLDRRTATRAGLAVGLIVIVAAVLAPSLLRSNPPGPSPTAPVAQASAGTPEPTTSLGPSATPDPWSDLEVPPFEPLAELTPLDADRLGVATATAFRVRSLTSTPAVELAAGLRTDPALELVVERGDAADVAIVRPAGSLTPGQRYHFRLSAPDGSLVGSWVFLARAPLQVVSTLPGHRTTGAPPNTGIEVTFDQDGSTGLPEHFSIEPTVSGRFEVHGRTWAFVPDRPLAPAAVYTVTVTRGVGVQGSTEVLEEDVVFQFETGLPDNREPLLTFGRAILEVRPNTAPDIAVAIPEDDDDRPRAPDAVVVQVHRLPTFRAVVDAADTLAGPDAWAVASPGAVVDTREMTRVARVEAPITESEVGLIMQLPARLAQGFYVLTMEQPGAPAQALLQVTDLSGYALTATDDMVVWVNDLATGDPIGGATVAIADGAQLGTTGSQGLIRTGTPAELAVLGDDDAGDVEDDGVDPNPPARFLTVRAPDGRRLLLALGLPMAWAYGEGRSYSWQPGNADWWVALFTDRDAYRQTDTVHVSGTVRARADRAVPDRVEIRLRPWDSLPDAAITRVTVAPSERGVFVADLRLDDLPRDEYAVDLFVGQARVSGVWIRVTEIRKPAYRIDLETDRRAYLVGDDVQVSASATFYDGSAVAGMDLRFEAFGDDIVDRTEPAGTAAATITSTFTDEPTGWTYEGVGVAPAHPEEGQISGERWVLVLPSRSWLVADGTVADGRIQVTGTLSRVDFAKLEAAIAADADLDPAGAPIGGGTVRAVVVHQVPVRREVGTTYDFIEKRVVPVYEYDERDEQIASLSLTTAADGTFRLSLTAPVPGDSYRITLTTQDAQGRRFMARTYATQAATRGAEGSRLPYLETLGFCATTPTIEAGIDEPVDLTMRASDGTAAEAGRLLFLVGSAGSVEATVQDAATFVRAMREADLPGFTVRAVWLSADGYFVADADVVVDPDEKAITVTLRPDKARYRPGGRVTIAITTTNSGGAPISADVILQGVDEKLYTLGLAASQDPLGRLLEPTSAGFHLAYRSHGVPSPWNEGGCGDTGGGDREDFRDTVTFQRISTDAAGRGVATFTLSDDLTSWRMTATAFSGNLDAGVGTVGIPVGLPFFVEAVLAPEYLVGDQAILRVRGYGEALAGDEAITFTVAAPSLGLAPTIISAKAFEAARVALPSLTPGDHAIRIEASVRQGGEVKRDVLIRTVHVVASRLAALSTTFEALGPDYAPRGGDGLTRFVVTDAGRGRLLGLLDRLASARSARFDRSVSAEVARAILIEEFGVPATSLEASGYSSERYSVDGIALLPYATPDLALTALAALVVPGEIDADLVRAVLREWPGSGSLPTRERSIIAVAGLAGLRDDVLDDLQAFDPVELTVIERLWLGLGLAAAGDDAAATVIERGVLEDAGQRLGPWVRLLGPTAAQSREASALLLLLAARLGDPLAHEVARYLSDDTSDERVFPLEELGYVLASLERLPRTPARFAWTLDGVRHEETLRPGGSFSLVLTRDQWRGLRLESLEGELGVSTTLEQATADLPDSPGFAITRSVTPTGAASPDELVRVALSVTFAGQAPRSCYRLTDLLPSGLAPVTSAGGWYDEVNDTIRHGPHEVEGQRVSWCVSPADREHIYEYVARVVTPGTYRWERAVLQWEDGPSLGTSTAETTYVIR